MTDTIRYACPFCNNDIVFEDKLPVPAESPATFSGFCFECGDWVDFERVKGGTDAQAANQG